MPPGGANWLYAYGMVRCSNRSCREVYREHCKLCGKCGTANSSVKGAEAEKEQEASDDD